VKTFRTKVWVWGFVFVLGIPIALIYVAKGNILIPVILTLAVVGGLCNLIAVGRNGGVMPSPDDSPRIKKHCEYLTDCIQFGNWWYSPGDILWLLACALFVSWVALWILSALL